jgi:hypothetical protein
MVRFQRPSKSRRTEKRVLHYLLLRALQELHWVPSRSARKKLGKCVRIMTGFQ